MVTHEQWQEQMRRRDKNANNLVYYHSTKGPVWPVGRPSSSGVPGVHWNGRKKRWQAWVWDGGGYLSIGFFETVEEAKRAQEKQNDRA